MPDPSSSTTSSVSILNVLTSLPLTHPSIPNLLDNHKPFKHASSLSTSSFNKFFNRINAAVLSKHAEGEAERRAGCDVARILVEQDDEGYILMQYGKGWVGSCLGVLSAATTPLPAVHAHLALLSSLVLTSPHYPSFERENIHPILGKLSVSLVKLIERCVAEPRPDWATLLHVLTSTRMILIHSPTPFRPLIPTLRPLLIAIILHLPLVTQQAGPSAPTPSSNHVAPHEITLAAADLLASLHLTSGKAQAPAAWGVEMKEAIGGLAMVMNGITADAWSEDPVRVTLPTPPPSLPPLPLDAGTRLPLALDMLDGWVEVILALLRFPTSRPVPVPVALIVASGLRCLNLTLDTPVVAHISPHHHATLFAALPRIWTTGLLLIGGIATTCGDHLFPHLSNIFDHTVWLSERIPSSMTETQAQLFRFHHLLLTLYPPALLPLDYPTRLLRLCLSKLSLLLESRPMPSAQTVANGGGKRGKKRARGAEDGLIGGLEGRDSRTIGSQECQVILEALKLSPLLHRTPLLSPELLTLSIRIHLSLHLSLPSKPNLPDHSALTNAVAHVLEEALLINESQSGTSPGWKSVILSVLDTRDDRVSLLLHPSLPPMIRPQPPLSALHFFAPETDEEKRIRLEMGFTSTVDDEDTALKDMDVDQIMESPAPQITSKPPPPIPQDPPSVTEAARLSSGPPDSAPATERVNSAPKPLRDISQPSPPIVIPAVANGISNVTTEIDTPVPIPFVSAPMTTSANKGKGKLVEPEIRRREESDSPIPELDSGSSGFEDFGDDDEEEDEEG